MKIKIHGLVPFQTEIDIEPEDVPDEKNFHETVSKQIDPEKVAIDLTAVLPLGFGVDPEEMKQFRARMEEIHGKTEPNKTGQGENKRQDKGAITQQGSTVTFTSDGGTKSFAA